MLTLPDESRDMSSVLESNSYHHDHSLTDNPVDKDDLSTMSMSSESEDDLFDCSDQEERYDVISQESSLVEQSLEKVIQGETLGRHCVCVCVCVCVSVCV